MIVDNNVNINYSRKVHQAFTLSTKYSDRLTIMVTMEPICRFHRTKTDRNISPRKVNIKILGLNCGIYLFIRNIC